MLTHLNTRDSGAFSDLQKLDLLHAVEAGLAVHHLEDLHLLEGNDGLVVEGLGPVHHRELALPNLPVDVETLEVGVGGAGVGELDELLCRPAGLHPLDALPQLTWANKN